MPRTKDRTCYHYRCNKPPVMGGLCQEHYNEDRAKEEARRDAIDAIVRWQVDGTRITSAQLRDELERVYDWWVRAHRALQAEAEDKVLLDETHFAPEWCIAIAGVIVKEERAHREGKAPDEYLQHIKQISWERFNFLAQGLMSNGVPRRAR